MKALQPHVAERISASQVIPNLASACKELVENALDSGAHKVEILLQDGGGQLMQISDDGAGIRSDQFEFLAKPHCTSKLQHHEDLASIQSYGFRGEALASLASLCDLTLTTRRQEDQVAFHVRFDHDGTMLDSVRCSREHGTTVRLRELFKTLSVRRKAMLNQISRERSALVQLVQAYAFCRDDVGFVCTDAVKDKGSTVLVKVSAGGSLRDRIVQVFGVLFLKSLATVQMAMPTEDEIVDLDLHEPHVRKVYDKIQLEGLISGCLQGQGRGSSDRQFLFVNNRICDDPKMNRLVTELYHQFNRSQYPAFILRLNVPADWLDVNLTPDKRSLLLRHEREVFAILRTSLLATYKDTQPIGLASLGSAAIASTSRAPASLVVANSGEERLSLSRSSASSIDSQHRKRRASSEESQKSARRRSSLQLAHTPPVNVGSVTEDDVPPAVATANVFESRQRETVSFGMEALEAALFASFATQTASPASTIPSQSTQDSSADETNDTDTTSSEYAPSDLCPVVLKRTQFKDMEIIGQFNLAFILALLHDNDVYIIDQHASDERYQLEKLEKCAVATQRLLQPRTLHLSALHEDAITNHMHLLRKSGFNLCIDDRKPVGERVQLTAIPVAAGDYHFTQGDIDELVHALCDIIPERSYRPSGLRQLFARRACRTAVMVGMPLNEQQMRTIVQEHMSILNHPWACAHGRPSVKWLFSVKTLGLLMQNECAG